MQRDFKKLFMSKKSFIWKFWNAKCTEKSHLHDAVRVIDLTFEIKMFFMNPIANLLERFDTFDRVGFVDSVGFHRQDFRPVVTNAIWWFWCTTLTTTWEMHDRVRFPISLSNLKCYGRRLNSYAPNFLWSVIVGGFDSSNDHKKLGA